MKQIHPMLQSALLALPIWTLLLIDVYALKNSLGKFSNILHAPGLFLMLLINPSWEQMHYYESWQFLIGDFVFYFLLILVSVLVIRRILRRKDDTKQTP